MPFCAIHFHTKGKAPCYVPKRMYSVRDKKAIRNRVFKIIFNIINMYALGFRNITINDKTSTGVMVVCLGPPSNQLITIYTL